MATPLSGAFVIELDLRADARGSFTRLFCSDEFAGSRLMTSIAQINHSTNLKAGTLRGIHYQLEPFSEVKIVRCTNGSVWDVMVDLRETSPTFCKWFGITLTAEKPSLVYVPKGFGHAYITLTDHAEVIYFVTEFYHPPSDRTARWDDPKFGIEWPREASVISEKDRNAPLFDRKYHLGR